MRLCSISNWYNPYAVVVGDKCYELCRIAMFDENGEITHNNKGWFGSNRHDADIEIDVDVKKKLKVDFSSKCAFIVKTENDYSGQPRYALYIPKTAFSEIKTSYEKVMDTLMIVKTTKTNVPSVYFEEFIPFGKKLTELRSKIREIGKTQETAYSYGEIIKVKESAELTMRYVSEYEEEYKRLDCAEVSCEEDIKNLM